MATKKYLDEAGAAYLVSKILALLNLKVSTVDGKGLSTEDFTTLLKEKLNSLENYSLPIASNGGLGGIKIGTGLTIDQNGVVSATGGGVADSIDWDNVLNKPDDFVYTSDIDVMSSEDIDALFE